MTAAEVLRLIAKIQFTKMSDLDREAFSGVKSDDALIGHNLVIDDNEAQYTIILDDERICLIDEWGYESHFNLGSNIFA